MLRQDISRALDTTPHSILQLNQPTMATNAIPPPRPHHTSTHPAIPPDLHHAPTCIHQTTTITRSDHHRCQGQCHQPLRRINVFTFRSMKPAWSTTNFTSDGLLTNHRAMLTSSPFLHRFDSTCLAHAIGWCHCFLRLTISRMH